MSKIHKTFDAFFSAATGLSGPYPYQRELATDASLPELRSVPTGVRQDGGRNFGLAVATAIAKQLCRLLLARGTRVA